MLAGQPLNPHRPNKPIGYNVPSPACVSTGQVRRPSWTEIVHPPFTEKSHRTLSVADGTETSQIADRRISDCAAQQAVSNRRNGQCLFAVRIVPRHPRQGTHCLQKTTLPAAVDGIEARYLGIQHNPSDLDAGCRSSMCLGNGDRYVFFFTRVNMIDPIVLPDKTRC